MNAACELCRGACCESLVFPVAKQSGSHSANTVWLRYHGEPVGDQEVELECKRRMLKDGKCSVNQTKPKICEDFKVGGIACRATVRRRRANWLEIFELMK